MYSVNAINHNLANLQSELIELIISWLLKLHDLAGMSVACEKDHHVPNQFINDGCQLFINGILVAVK